MWAPTTVAAQSASGPGGGPRMSTPCAALIAANSPGSTSTGPVGMTGSAAGVPIASNILSNWGEPATEAVTDNIRAEADSTWKVWGTP